MTVNLTDRLAARIFRDNSKAERGEIEEVMGE